MPTYTHRDWLYIYNIYTTTDLIIYWLIDFSFWRFLLEMPELFKENDCLEQIFNQIYK